MKGNFYLEILGNFVGDAYAILRRHQIITVLAMTTNVRPLLRPGPHAIHLCQRLSLMDARRTATVSGPGSSPALRRTASPKARCVSRNAAERSDSLARKHELVAIHIFENGGGSPIFAFGLLLEHDVMRFHDLRRSKDIVTPEGQRLKITDAILVAIGREQRQSRLRAGNLQFDPALL